MISPRSRVGKTSKDDLRQQTVAGQAGQFVNAVHEIRIELLAPTTDVMWIIHNGPRSALQNTQAASRNLSGQIHGSRYIKRPRADGVRAVACATGASALPVKQRTHVRFAPVCGGPPGGRDGPTGRQRAGAVLSGVWGFADARRRP